ncbi:hypothetical protein I2483_12765 [Sporosarcina sp. E16_3]|uniref:hypothetical protein n=1 Tax=unclassified Sporosarcina TaxID=2647733 RepID=UPI0016489338|nr:MULTISPECIES: hypothetical protein [unclassified Sporosarcina]MBO0602531.1 hypothetical protein [Sporosarcina sp. E16_3]
MTIKAYMVNDYYIFTDYNELSSHIHDVIHFTRPTFQDNRRSFSIITGKIHQDEMVFVNDNGDIIPLAFEQEDDLYYSALRQLI